MSSRSVLENVRLENHMYFSVLRERAFAFGTKCMCKKTYAFTSAVLRFSLCSVP